MSRSKGLFFRPPVLARNRSLSPPCEGGARGVGAPSSAARGEDVRNRRLWLLHRPYSPLSPLAHPTPLRPPFARGEKLRLREIGGFRGQDRRHPALAGCGAVRTKQGASPSLTADAIERSAEKGPVKLLVRVWPRKPRLSDLVEMDVRIESQPGVEVKPPAFGQAVGDFLIRDYTERPPEAGCRTSADSITSSSRRTPANI